MAAIQHGILLVLAAFCGVAHGSINITSPEEYTLNGGVFHFTCTGSTSLVNLTVLINNQTYDSDRLTQNIVSSTKVMFKYSNVTPFHNGTTFACLNTSNKEKSSKIVLQVAFVKFIEQVEMGSEIWFEMKTNSTGMLHCTVLANPPNVTSITATNSSVKHDNVQFKVNNKTGLQGIFTITKAQLSNRGNYTCTASNGLASDSITYNTFIGGAPMNTSISGIKVMEMDSYEIVISYTITDNSIAPSMAVNISITGLVIAEDKFDMPIRGGPVERNYTILMGLDEIVPSFYNIELTPFNMLGFGLPTTSKQFLNGANYTVNIATSNTDVMILTNFTINCTSSSKYVNMSLLVNGSLWNASSNVKQLFAKNLTKGFVFITNETYYNGTIFMCIGDNDVFSDFVIINVLYPPVFSVNTNATQWSEYAVGSHFNLSCTLENHGNPMGSLHYLNTSKKEPNVNVTATTSQVLYKVHNATIKNRVNFTCIANNSIGQSNSTYLAYVGGAPKNVTVTHSVTVNSTQYVILCLNITDNSSAPARSFSLVIKGIYNYTINITGLPQMKYQFNGLLNKKASLFGNSTHRVIITANNTIGSAVVYNHTLNIPAISSTSILSPTMTMTSTKASHSPSKSKVAPKTKSPTTATSSNPTAKPTSTPTSTPTHPPNNSGLIAAGVIVPIVVVILLAFVVGAVYYFYKNRKDKGFRLLVPTDQDIGDNSYYGSRRNT